MKNLNYLLKLVLVILPMWATAGTLKPTFDVDKPKVCLEPRATSEVVTFTNTTEEGLWTGNITYVWRFVNLTSKDSIIKNGPGPYTLTLTEGDWAILVTAEDEKTPKKNVGEERDTVYIGRKKLIKMVSEVTACIGSVAEINGGFGFEKYLWLKGKDTVGTNRILKVPVGSGKYDLFATSYAGCKSQDSVLLKREICNPTAIEENKLVQQIKISPNPATDFVTIGVALVTIGELKISFVDAMGKEVRVENLGTNSSFEKNIDLVNMTKGLYQVRYLVNGNAVKTERLVIQ